MRRLASILVSSALASFVCAAGAPAAHATLLDFTGTLSLAYGNNGSSDPFFSETVSGVGAADVTRVGADIDGISGLPAGVFEFEGELHPFGPEYSPITSIRLNATNDQGGFGSLTTPSGGGFMTVVGRFTLELAGGAAEIFLLTADEDDQGIGLGGAFDVGGLFTDQFDVELQANDWTTGSVTNGFGTFSGFSIGNSVRLVSPFAYVSRYPSGLTIVSPGVAILELEFASDPVPEPGTAVLLASGMMLLGSRARAARRGGSAKTRC